MPSTSEKRQEKKDFGQVRVERHGTGWLIEFCGDDPDTKYLPADPDQVKSQVKKETRRASREGRFASAG